MKLPKYKYLLTYRYAEIIYHLTVEFCQRFLLGNLSHLGTLGNIPTRRTVEQMVQAARSGKQNIIEGVSQQASRKGEIKLLGISEASYEELIADYEDFLNQRKLSIWDKNDPRVNKFRQIGVEATSFLRYPKELRLPMLPTNPEEAANLMLTFCHQETYLLSRQIKSAEEKFIREGGYTENLFRQRLKARSSNYPK